MLSLKVSEHSAKEEKEEGAKQLEEVREGHVGVAHGCEHKLHACYTESTVLSVH